MAGEDARLKAGLKSAEDELNLIKNQIQQTLLDIREHILDVTNPFNSVAPELLDDDEEMSIEDSGGDGAGGDMVEGEGGDEIIEEGDGSEVDEDIEAIDDELGDEEELIAGGDEYGDEIEEVPEDEIIDDGTGAGSGGLAEMIEGSPEDELEEEPDGFDLDEDEDAGDELENLEGEMSEFEADIEEEDDMEQMLPEDEREQDSGDGVADAVSAALAANVDLLTMASLVRWTAVTRERLGSNRLDILLDAYEMAGRISPQMKNVVRTLSALGDEDADGIPVRDVVTAMVRMDGVLNSGENRESNRLLGLLLDMDEDPLDRLAA